MRVRARRVAGFVFDWRNGATLVASVAVVLITFVVIDGSIARQETRELARRAIEQANLETQRGIESREASTARITELQNRVGEFGFAIQQSVDAQGQAIAESKALAAQIEALGAKPVVTPRAAPEPVTITTRPAPTTQPVPAPTTTVPPVTTTTTAAPKVTPKTTTTTVPVRRSLTPSTTTTTVQTKGNK